MAAAVALASPLRRLLHCPCPRRAIATPLRFFARGRCDLALAVSAAAVGDKWGVHRHVIEEVMDILDMAQRASQRRDVFHTSFLTPPIIAEAMLAIEKLADIKAVAQGGYPQAERCRISVGHPDSMRSDPDVVAALSISGNFRLEPCSHGDFLGAILGAGITREKVGDILLQGERGAQVLVDPELVDYLTSTLEKVGKVGVSCTQIPLLAIEYEPPRTKSFKTVESSLRVDAVASAGFKISRTKLGSMISSGDVRVNWSLVSKSGATLKAGDVVSVSGMGRLKVFENMLGLALYSVCNWGNRDYEERQICRSVDSIFVGP
ncbi:putative RNA-binding protein YlmH isoform X1 [Triticum urartu]|uniref:putative RNA-binding protein YlmH isoform X2 n=1 Tax=Triticum dicoccoides TaxID=85692 RepID=UPI00188EE19E|nr:putative RNA-binding protein YlmH isoform X2 [Triticum dicoccoides]XP_048564312.1 putative RNA-binding protein YlmH isoform X1 [Triticum urartu]